MFIYFLYNGIMNNVELFADILSVVHDISLWSYEPDGTLISTTSRFDSQINIELYDEHIELIRTTALEHKRPSIISSLFSTSWIIASARQDGQLKTIYALGPFYIDSFPKNDARDQAYEQNLSLNGKQRLFGILCSLPVISFMKVFDYAIMMHYTITSEKISIYDLHVSYSRPAPSTDDDQTQYHGTYQMEQEILRMIREGDLGLIDFTGKMSANINVGKLANDDSDPLRQVKNTVLVAITLYSRAAIEGGLYPDTAMTLTDRYFQAIEAADSIQEVGDITMTMQEDFVTRVHRIKTSNRYSKAILSTVEYIDLHKEDDIFLSDIAKELGYTEYYLSRKFKNEVGSTFKEYIRNVRLEYSKFLLTNEIIPVREISERLKFTSQSYFTDRFKEKYGITPNEYRLKNR